MFTSRTPKYSLLVEYFPKYLHFKNYNNTSYMVPLTTQQRYFGRVSKAQGVFIQIFKALAIF